MEEKVERVWKAFREGRPIYGLMYFPKTRVFEKLQLVEEKKTVYRCKYVRWVFDQSTNNLIRKSEGERSIRKSDMEFHMYDLTPEELIKSRIGMINSEIDFLEKVRILGLRKEAEVLEKYLKGEFINLEEVR